MPISRRHFLYSASLLSATALTYSLDAASAEPIIDIHQHTNYSGRTNEQLIEHQKNLGVTHTVLLPAGSQYGLDAQIEGNDAAMKFCKETGKAYSCFANEVTDQVGAADVIRSFLKKGARGIGEQKFKVRCNSPEMDRIASLAQEFKVPVLMHFQHETYNTSYETFYKTLEKFPKVNFIGHAQTFWGYIDAKHQPKELYPLSRVTRGGLTDRYLSDYPNFFGDLSAASGLNSMIRDEEHARGFLDRHQKQLMFGSDCNDVMGRGPACTGTQILAAIRRLAPNKKAERRILYGNAHRLLRVG